MKDSILTEYERFGTILFWKGIKFDVPTERFAIASEKEYILFDNFLN